MPKKIKRLKDEAKEACKHRGHDMENFEWDNPTKTKATSTCSICGAYVQVDTKPPANGIEIGGNALALTCEVTQSVRKTS